LITPGTDGVNAKSAPFRRGSRIGGADQNPSG